MDESQNQNVATNEVSISPVEIHAIIQEERNGDMSLKPEARERIKDEIARYIAKRGYVDISSIARLLKTNFQTARALITEVIEQWREEDADFMTSHKRWLQNMMTQLDDNPDIFDEKMITLIELKTSLANQIMRISRLERGELSAGDMDEFINFKVVWSKTLKPKTRKLIEEHLSKADDKKEQP